MKKIILILLSVFFYSSSFANNHNDNTIDLIQGTISEGLEEISSSGQSAGNILGGTYTFFDFNEQVSWNTDVEACVKTPEIPSYSISVAYPSGVSFSEVCGSICLPELKCSGDWYNPDSWKCNWEMKCSDVCTGIYYPTGVSWSSVSWKVFPGINAVSRCQNVEAIDVKIGGSGILQYSPEAALFSTILKGEMYGFPLEYGIECKLPLSGDFEITFDMISRTITNIDNSDGSAYSTDIGIEAPEFDPGNLANPSEILVPAEIEVEPSYEFELGGTGDDAAGEATTTHTVDKAFDSSSVNIPKDDLKTRASGESDSDQNAKKGNVRERVMSSIDDSPFCEIIDTFPSITPPGIAADAIFNIAPLQGSMAVGVNFGISSGGASAGNYAFVLPTLTLDQTLLVIKNGSEIGVPGGSINILPKNPVEDITNSFVNEINGFANQMQSFFSAKTVKDYLTPFCASSEVVDALKWVGQGIGDMVSGWSGGSGGDIFQMNTVCG